MNELTPISFFSRFEEDILSGAKTITLRDEAESHFKVGETLSVTTFEDERWFCNIKVLSVTKVAFHHLTEDHAEQENMSLEFLKSLIQEVYPGVEELFEIKFQLLN
ncbi:N(4)-acetylcytidine aminohydrolase [Shewanella sp. TC10]|uniref:N(4)-acetylcytidine aminohydrolase n=1 Tax=Shewanella sp. TC10 TaxID=1419739 RepID=UPI00129EB398|nr:N(4)-acetylcytidine aminohydrolase [Shewanella sp. TC10]